MTGLLNLDFFHHFALNSCVRKLISTEREKDGERVCNGWMELEFYWILNSKRYVEQILSHIDNSSLLPMTDTRDRAKENKD